VALGDNLLDVDGGSSISPDRAIANLDDAKKAITVQHLLDMTSASPGRRA